jgi:proline dehydrogenase
MPIARNLLLALSRSTRLRDSMIHVRPARAVARRFVAGETLSEAIAAVQTLNRHGLLASLDHLGESVADQTGARDATAEILDLLDAIQAGAVRSGVSVKLTQLGLSLSPALAADNLERIVAHAAEVGRFVRIDMENSEYVQPTLDLFEALWARHKNVGVVIQAYLYRSAEDVARLIRLGASVRLVKGAYNEPSAVAYPLKADTDANYLRLAEQLLSPAARASGVFPAIATHDTRLIDWTADYARQQGIPPDRFEFQMLYGIRPALQRRLAAAGHRVRIYTPYGRQWYPYLMRRLAERPANLFFLVRSLFRR